jgi:uncharacterized repeat protein (TIGR01451 family)
LPFVEAFSRKCFAPTQDYFSSILEKEQEYAKHGEEQNMKKIRRLISLALGLALALMLSLGTTQPARADEINVTTNNDVLDAADTCANITLVSLPGPDAVVSLREAMCAANNHSGADLITFSIPGAGVQTIHLGTPLPPLTDDSTAIDGYSQTGAAPATNTDPAIILIEIDGSVIFLNNGFNVISSGNMIRGLAIYGFGGSGIYIRNFEGSIANNNLITGNYIGTNSGGVLCQDNGTAGVFVGYGAQNNTIGGNVPPARNLISCNGWAGVEFHGAGTMGNVVSGNYIGIDPQGTTSRANSLDGVRIYGGAQNNTVGGDTPGERNILSGNARDGVRIVGTGTTGNRVMGNFIGLEPDGASGRSNDFNGVYIGGGAQDNTIGGDIAAGESNVISRNLVGVAISDTLTMSNTVSGNFIGTNFLGTVDAGNFADGVGIIGGAQNNLIGGDTPGERNVISGNDISGVYISGSGTTGNVVSGNYIGLNYQGTAGLRNAQYGVTIEAGAQGNTIGGDTAGRRNVVSANPYGVRLHGAGTDSNTVIGNYVGTDADGLESLGNDYGVYIERGAQNNTIGGASGTTPGGPCTGACNLISGNLDYGVYISDPSTSGNVVSHNYIGTTVSGLIPLGNTRDGIQIDEASDNSIGPRNLISGNGDDGVEIEDSAAGNTVFGNYIGVDASGTSDLGNDENGVYLSDFSDGNTIGPDNVISGNGDDGVDMYDDAEDNIVFGNYIGVDVSGTIDLGNDDDGVNLREFSSGNTIGPDNVISGNGDNGVKIQDFSNNNIVSGNLIGTDASGSSDLGNTNCGVSILLDAQNNTVGGDASGDRNLISGNNLCGVSIRGGGTSGNTVTGNYIGTDASGTQALHNGDDGGVHILWGAHDNTIGPYNLIAFNHANGVRVGMAGTTGNVITRNSIHDNEAMGIDLYDGGNNVLPAPVIVDTTIGSVTIVGTACGGCTVEVFENSDTDGEGETFVGSTTAEAGGDFSLTVDYLNQLYLTATATHPTHGTSEFSEVLTAMIPLLSTSTKTVDRSSASPGYILTYTITLNNTGIVAASARVTDTLPTEVTWVNEYSISAGILNWDAVNDRLEWTGTVNVGTPVTIVYQVRVNRGVPDGWLFGNSASVADGTGRVIQVGPATVTVIAYYLYLPLVMR